MKDIVVGVARHLLTAGGGFVAAQGYATTDDTNLAVGAIVTLIGFSWSVIEKIRAKKA